jgi:aminobenzoyl-glutamate transport protein
MAGTESFVLRALARIERAGNALPHPVTLFLGFTGLVVLASWVWAGSSVLHPATGVPVTVQNLASVVWLKQWLAGALGFFTGFAPLGTVLVAMLGLGIAEGSGLIKAVIRHLLLRAPRRFVTALLVFAGILSHTAADAGYVLVIPLGAVMFAALGRHPLAGLAAGFAGVSGGFSANLLISPLDPMLAGFTQEAARLVDPLKVVGPLSNYWFMSSSSILIVLAGTWVTERLIEPRLATAGGWSPPAAAATAGDYALTDQAEPLSVLEQKGLRAAGVVLLVWAGLLCWGLIPGDGYLRSAPGAPVLQSPVISGIVPLIFIVSATAGLVFGWVVGSFRSDQQVVGAMESSMASLASYIVLAFFTAQFIAFFNASGLGLMLAVNGAAWLKSTGLGAVPLMTGFLLLTVLLDLVIGSASAKWAAMAAVFVPMFMLAGYPPELTQAAYRIGDSVANVITPLMPYFPLVMAYMRRYVPDAGMGTLMALMLPYSVVFLLVWTSWLAVWILAGWPLGL